MPKNKNKQPTYERARYPRDFWGHYAAALVGELREALDRPTNEEMLAALDDPDRLRELAENGRRYVYDGSREAVVVEAAARHAISARVSEDERGGRGVERSLL